MSLLSPIVNPVNTYTSAWNIRIKPDRQTPYTEAVLRANKAIKPLEEYWYRKSSKTKSTQSVLVLSAALSKLRLKLQFTDDLHAEIKNLLELSVEKKIADARTGSVEKMLDLRTAKRQFLLAIEDIVRINKEINT